MLRQVPTPVLAALVGLLALVDLARPSGADAVDPEADVIPAVLPRFAFDTGPAAIRSVEHRGLTVSLERAEGDKLAIVLENAGTEEVHVDTAFEVVRVEGLSVGRMGPMAFTIKSDRILADVPPGIRATRVLADVDLPAGEPLALQFSSTRVVLDGEHTVLFSDAPDAAALADAFGS